MDIPNLTPEQEHRRDLMYLLNDINSTNRHSNVIWLHFTDISDRYDLFDELRRLQFIMPHATLKYVPNNSWQDHFPPTAYFFSFNALAILNYPSNWIFDGVIGNGQL